MTLIGGTPEQFADSCRMASCATARSSRLPASSRNDPGTTTNAGRAIEIGICRRLTALVYLNAMVIGLVIGGANEPITDHDRDLGCDRVRALTDGRVQVEGCDVNYITMPVEECFERALFSRQVQSSRNRLQPVSDRAVARGCALCRGAGVSVAHVSAFGGLHPHRPRHRGAGRSARQARRRARFRCRR